VTNALIFQLMCFEVVSDVKFTMGLNCYKWHFGETLVIPTKHL